MLDRLEEQHRREVGGDSRAAEMQAAEERRTLQVKYDDVFAAYNETAPPPVAGQSADDYERSLMRLTQRRLSAYDERKLPGSELSVSDLARMSYEFRVIDSAGKDSQLDLPLVDRKAMIRWGRAWRMWPVI